MRFNGKITTWATSESPDGQTNERVRGYEYMYIIEISAANLTNIKV